MLEFRNIRKSYGPKNNVLQNISFTVDDGEFIFITGESGSGKTTLLKMLVREIMPSQGQILYNGENICTMNDKNLQEYRRNLGISFQDCRLLPQKNVYENIAFVLRAVVTPPSVIETRIKNLLSTTELAGKEKLYPSQLSCGEKQMTALARAFANNPSIILADEPFANLDNDKGIEIMNILIRANNFKKTVIVATHRKEFIDYYKYRTIALKNGEIVSDTPRIQTSSIRDNAVNAKEW